MIDENLNTLAKCLGDTFIQRWDLYAQQLDNGAYICVKEPLTHELIRAHLEGELTLGTYLLFGGLLLSSLISFSLARDARKQIFRQPDTCNSPDRAGDILWVSLDDEHGNPLPAVDARRKLDEARAKAGPMDQVRVKPSK